MTNLYHDFKKFKLEAPTLGLNRDEFIKRWNDDKVATEKAIAKALTALINDTYGILCLSEDKDNIKMWSHYANKHTGVVLEFDFQKILTKGKDYYWKVNYPGVGKFLNFLDKEVPSNSSFFGQLITKASVWEEENEVRICAVHSGLHPMNPECFTGLIFGINTNVEEKITLVHLVGKNYPNVKFSQADRDEDDFKINIVPLDVKLHIDLLIQKRNNG